MRLSLTKDQLNNIHWVEWHNKKHDTTTAHAEDPTSLDRTGVRRALNGAVIPADAKPARPETPRDAFSIQLIAQLHEKLGHEEEKARAKAARAKKMADGVRVVGEAAEVWAGGNMVGTFPARVLADLPEIVEEHLQRVSIREKAHNHAIEAEAARDAAPTKKKGRKVA